MTRRLAIIVLLLTTFMGELRAQWDVQFTDFTALKSYFNPGASGTDGLLNVSGTFSMQMLGYEGAPKTFFFGADCPIYFLNSHHGAGINFMNDKTGIFNAMKLSLQYSYNVKLGKNSKLALGVQGAMLSETIDASDAEMMETTDKAFPSSKQKGNQFDLGIGLYFVTPKYWVGFSGQHLLAPTVKLGETNEISLARVYYLMGGYNFKFRNSLISLEPAAMVQSDFQSWRVDMQCKVPFEIKGKQVYAGIGYSPTNSVTFMVGGMFHGACLGYSYQMYTNGVGYQNGTHEITAAYRNKLDLFKKGRNKHKSVRWL